MIQDGLVTRLRRTAMTVVLSVLPLAMSAHAESAWVLWKHAYEVWVDSNKDNHRRDVAWKKVATTSNKSDCNDRALSEARAEYDTLTGKGVRATLAGSAVGFDQRNTRFSHGYRSFECWPGTVDPRGPRGR
jgi:hypothetical protein